MLNVTKIREVVITRRVTVTHGYEDSAILAAFMSARAMEPALSDYGEAIRLTFDGPEDEVPGFVATRTQPTRAGTNSCSHASAERAANNSSRMPARIESLERRDSVAT